MAFWYNITDCYAEEISGKTVITMNIPDEYEHMDEELQEILWSYAEDHSRPSRIQGGSKMKELIIPSKLNEGDTIAFISISGGRAGDEDMQGILRYI